VRVRTDRLDRLIDMVGELVIAHSMVSEDGDLAAGGNADLVRKVAHSGKIVRELQDLSMSMRMVPLKPTFLKMSRLVRDLTHKNDRQVAFQTSGEDTEIDRNMVDVLADPLIHMLRNACDHGVEPPDERAAAGKDRAGRVMLSAYHAGGNVVVELKDDGRGLNREKIARKAVERGLIESDKGMLDSDVYGLIFEAGFSTAEKVTEVSGRGVGMDVVRRAVQSLRGRIEIQSELGRGTTFAIKLPLTLAVTDGMLIRVGAQRFILPTASIQVSFRPEEKAVKSVLGRGELVMLRNELIPMVRLHQVFGIPGAIEMPTNALLVIIADGERRSAVLVDEILGQQQVVAKSLGEGAGKVEGVAGGAILGDGRVGLILDPAGLIGLARGGSNWEHRTLVEAIG
jgi:two-component system chemotaxis sensor kinase CheA